MEQTVLGIFSIKKEVAEPTDDLEDVGVITEGVEVHSPFYLASFTHWT